MRYIPVVLVFLLSNLAIGQNVLTKFEEQVIDEDFTTDNNNFAQKYNVNELFVIENGVYKIKRLHPGEYSVSYARLEEDLKNHSISATVSLARTKSKLASCGIVLHAQNNGNGAIILEINNSKRFRVKKIHNGQEQWLSGIKDDGWIKSKLLSKSGPNTLEVRTANGYYDIYINGTFVYSAFDLQYTSGRCGLYVNGGSEMSVSRVTIMREKKNIVVQDPGNAGTDSSNPSFQDVILIFTAKIDKQQKEIERLQNEVNQCKSMLNYDTAVVAQAAKLETENQRMSYLLDSLNRELVVAKKRLEYLESFKEDVEAASNGDIIINLTTILAELKKENKDLANKNAQLSTDNAELKKENEALHRELERLRKLSGIGGGE